MEQIKLLLMVLHLHYQLVEWIQFLLQVVEEEALKPKMEQLVDLVVVEAMEMMVLLVSVVLVILHLQVHHKEILVVLQTHLTSQVVEVVLAKLVTLTKMVLVEMELNHQ